MYEISRLEMLDYDDLISVEQHEIKEVKDRPEADNKLRKAIFFLFAEGFLRTLSKIKSKSNKSLIVPKYKTIIKVKYNGKNYINHSIQTSTHSNDFVIKNAFFETQDSQDYSINNNQITFNQFSGEETYFERDSRIFSIPEKKLNSNNDSIAVYNEGVFLYGLGDYARVYIAPNIKNIKKIFCVDYVSTYSNYYKNAYQFDYNGLVPQDSYHTIGSVKKPLVIIATYHSDHTRIAKELFDINPNTLFFIEKPPCVTPQDIVDLVDLYRKGAKIEIGYNRRFIPINQEIKRKLKGQKAVINISIKEILINDNHWYFWENQGTRITGNLTHWVDICNFWLEDEIPVELSMLKSPTKDETFSVSILYSGGSIANITVSDKGNPLRGVQEKIEIRTEFETYFIDDYLKMYFISKNGRKTNKSKIKRIKGHDNMYKHVVNLLSNKSRLKYSVEDLVKTAITTYHLSEMFRNDTKNSQIKDHIMALLKNNKE
jgi:predicted dehydrogenase